MDAYKVLKELKEKQLKERKEDREMKLVKKSGIRESLKRRKIRRLKEQGGEYVWVMVGKHMYKYSSPGEAGILAAEELQRLIANFSAYHEKLTYVDVDWGKSKVNVAVEITADRDFGVFIGDEDGHFIRDLSEEEREEFERELYMEFGMG